MDKKGRMKSWWNWGTRCSNKGEKFGSKECTQLMQDRGVVKVVGRGLHTAIDVLEAVGSGWGRGDDDYVQVFELFQPGQVQCKLFDST